MAKTKNSKTIPKAKDANSRKPVATKPTKPLQPAKSNLSQEKVVDSDNDDDESSAEKAPTKLKKPGNKPDADESEADVESSGSSESEKIKPALKKPAIETKQVNGVKRKADESDENESSEDDDSSEEGEKDSQPQIKRAKTAPDTAESESSSGSERDSEDDDETDDEDKSNHDKLPKALNKTSKEREAPPTEFSVKSIPPPPYEPPADYSFLDTSALASTSPFSSSNIAGKQIWLITAPSNVPLKSVTELAATAIQDETPILNHKGMDYILRKDKSRDPKFNNVLLPTGLAGYKLVNHGVQESLHLQPKLSLPDVSKPQNKSMAAANIGTAAVSSVRPQPKGLRMRYRPPGFGKGDPGRVGSGSESEEEEPRVERGFQFPRALGLHGVANKSNSTLGGNGTKEKSKKKRQSENVEMRDADTSEVKVNGDSDMPAPSSNTPLKKKKRDKLASADNTPVRPSTVDTQRSSQSTGSVEKKETKEEKAKRKEARRLKTEEKEKATEN